jgi:fluoroacetyl-CoA thioesterase
MWHTLLARACREGEMKGNPKTGTLGEQRFVVESKHAIDFADAQMPAVLSTPWLIWFLEHAARAAVLPLLEPGESTVGTLVEVRHLAATPVGQSVTCLARVVQAEGRVVSFQLEARDEHEVICRGYHKLRVINMTRFADKVRDKAGKRGLNS